MKRGFSPGKVIDLTQDSPPRPKKRKDFSTHNNKTVTSNHRQDSQQWNNMNNWYGNRYLMQQSWIETFRHNTGQLRNQNNQFCTDAGQSSHHPQPSLHTGQSFGRGGKFASTRSDSGVTSKRLSVGNQEDFELPSPDVFSQPSDHFRVGLNPDPESFRAVAEYLATKIPEHIQKNKGNRFKSLSSSIWNEFNKNQQSLATMMQKIDLWNEIYRVIRIQYDCGLFIFGSTFNGFGGRNSDVDMCLFLDRGVFFPDKEKLISVKDLLRRHCSHFIAGGNRWNGGIELIPAKIPILKFKDKVGNLEVDLSVDNPASIRNTHLLFYYSKMDYRVRPLVMAVKTWAKKHGINEAKNQTLSSFALTIMVINFLQIGVSPMVVPCLQERYPQMFRADSDIFNLDYNVPLEFCSENNHSLGDLLVGFFNHYVFNFDSDSDVASIRTGRILARDTCEAEAKAKKNSPGQWKARLLLEEPFTRTNVGRAVCNDKQYQLIQQKFRTTNNLLQKQNATTTNINFFSLL